MVRFAPCVFCRLPFAIGARVFSRLCAQFPQTMRLRSARQLLTDDAQDLRRQSPARRGNSPRERNQRGERWTNFVGSDGFQEAIDVNRCGATHRIAPLFLRAQLSFADEMPYLQATVEGPDKARLSLQRYG